MSHTSTISIAVVKITFVFLWTFFSLSGYSQNYYFENYSIRQGLPNSKIYDILQDDQGYIWIASPSGLSRFDGDKFITYGMANNLPENSVRALFLDQDKQLWVGFEDGRVYVKNQDVFQLIINDSINPKGEISDISQNLKGEILISTIGSGVFLIRNYLEISKREILNFTGKEGAGQTIYKSEAFINGQIFLATSVDLMYMDADSAKFHYYRPNGFPLFFLSTCMIEDSRGNIWIGKYNGGLYKYDTKSKKFSFYDHRDGLANNWISTLFEDSLGRIWVGTWGGGVSLIKDDKIIVNFDNKNGLVSLNIQKIIEDNEGNIYIATQENGFQIFKGMQFLSLTEDNGLPNLQIWDICELNDSIVLLATNNGISEIVFQSTVKVRVRNNYQKSPDGLISNKILHLIKDDIGNVWIGTALSGIQNYKISTGVFEYNRFLNANIPQNAKLVSDLEIVDGELYFGTVDGLINHEIVKEKNYRLSQENGLSGNNISVLFKDSENTLWVGVRNKGVCFIKDNTITALPKTKHISPTCLAENSKKEILLGSSKGIFRLENDTLIKILDVNTGLMSNYVSLLHFINDDKLMIGSNNGLSIYQFSNNTLVHYNKSLGYTGIETKNNSFLQRSDGSILLGTTGGLMIYNPNYKDIRKPVEPYVHIGEIKVNMIPVPLTYKEPYPYSKNSFLFYYHAISMSNQSDLQYQVMLEGLDNTWRNPTKSTNISFSKLPYGEYTFKVKAITFDGIENQTPASYHFIIRPPFWETWWFIGGSLFLIFISTFFGVRYRIYLLKKEKEELEQKVADRTKEISEKNELLVEKNNHITDSINYARRIQYATMRPEALLNKLYDDAFILYLPKDIVSGDFYWYTQKGDHIIIAAADCTGHGVPGAFMSMLGIAYLNEIVGRTSKYDAAAVLQKLRSNVINALNQSDSEDSTKDGMDIALIIFNKKTKKLQYAGAYNPLYLLRNKELIEYKADRMPIGVHSRDNLDFTNHSIELIEGDQLYIFTDGFADQFGGPKGKKMNYKRFKNLILEQQGVSREQQRENLLHAFNTWKGKEQQLDDVLLIGLNI